MNLKIVSAKIKLTRFHNVLNLSNEINERIYGKELCEARIAPHLEIKCIFPKCKKVNILTGFVVGDSYCCYPLYGYNGRDEISINEYNKIVQNAIVEIDSLWEDDADAVKPEELTPEIIQAVKDNCKIKADKNNN